MKFLYLLSIGAVLLSIGFFMPGVVLGGAVVKLPYAAGQAFVVTQGYHSPPTHINKDDFAIDFTQNKCDAYGKKAVAALSGRILLAQESGYNGGYGTQVLIISDDNIVTRYAHLIPASIPFAPGATIQQGMALGEIGDTGLVMGTACNLHPGTHLHFAMDRENSDGSLTAKNPEPISGYEGIKEGNWYLSDNAIESNVSDLNQNSLLTQTPSGSSPDISLSSLTGEAAGDLNDKQNVSSQVLENPDSAVQAGAATSGQARSVSSSNLYLSTGSSSIISEVNLKEVVTSTTIVPNLGGVLVVSDGLKPSLLDTSPTTVFINPTSESSSDFAIAPNQSATTSSQLDMLSAPKSITSTVSIATFNSSTLMADFSWQPSTGVSSGTVLYEIFSMNNESASTPILVGTTTQNYFSYPVVDSTFGTEQEFAVQAFGDAGQSSSMVTTTILIPDWFSVLQPIDENDSRASWYNDNWYDLGSGFSGTLRAVELEGYVNSDSFASSTVMLQEFSDAHYSQLEQAFPISLDVPFVQSTAKVFLEGLNIVLHPAKYYRLTTYQQYQNRSVILKGTDSTGTAMWDNYVAGVGGVQYQYAFYPYLKAVIVPRTLPLPSPLMLGDITTAFDSGKNQVDVSWPAATDTDQSLDPLEYEVNISTTTTLDSSAWESVGASSSAIFPVDFPNSYEIGVRAVDEFGDTSAPLTTSWSFPMNYNPVPTQLDHSQIIGYDSMAMEITFTATTTASGINFWIAPIPSPFCCSNTSLSVYKDNGGAYGEEVPAGHTGISLPSNGQDGEVGYDFSSSIVFWPGSYWFVMNPPGRTNPTAIYGSSDGLPYFQFEQSDGP